MVRLAVELFEGEAGSSRAAPSGGGGGAPIEPSPAVDAPPCSEHEAPPARTDASPEAPLRQSDAQTDASRAVPPGDEPVGGLAAADAPAPLAAAPVPLVAAADESPPARRDELSVADLIKSLKAAKKTSSPAPRPADTRSLDEAMRDLGRLEQAARDTAVLRGPAPPLTHPRAAEIVDKSRLAGTSVSQAAVWEALRLDEAAKVAAVRAKRDAVKGAARAKVQTRRRPPLEKGAAADAGNCAAADASWPLDQHVADLARLEGVHKAKFEDQLRTLRLGVETS
ncbi:hypothetical protein M885DRAFT_520923 [Pelagophyceae sp. CCMP2097]|nr:hypothetical protein M885DRAFT_520923 [Pelagophyceae sp. CCMP2097]